MHPSQKYTPGPATSFSHCSLCFPQNEHRGSAPRGKGALTRFLPAPSLIASLDHRSKEEPMLLSLVYLVVRMLLRLLVRDSQGDAAKDLEIVVLRHQLNVLRRQVKRSRFRRSDRVFLAAAARRLPRTRWERFLVTPKTLLPSSTGSWSG